MKYALRCVPQYKMPKYAVVEEETGEDEAWFFKKHKACDYIKAMNALNKIHTIETLRFNGRGKKI